LKNIYLWSKTIVGGTLLPTLWFSAKTYFEENGSSVDHWQWHDPFIHNKSVEEILDYCKDNPPDFFGFSMYIWNHLDADILAQEIRKHYPNCLIVYGGPQVDIKYTNDFFIQKPWVDLVVPSDVYGEPILTYILDNFDELKHQEIPEVYYHRNGMKFRSKHEFIKRSFKWPKNIFSAQKEYFNFETTNSMVVYESTRGCPYKCSYCDWGGGTYTKVVRKPMETIFSELEFLVVNGIESFYFADANFGIYKDDIDIVHHIIKLKKQYGFPLAMSVENAKNNLDRVIEIQRLLIENQLVFYYKISIQNPHPEIKANIERVDIPFEEQINAVLELRKQYDAPILIETILGLPGDSYQKTLDSIDLFNQSNIESFRPAIWNLLPEAPAYAPEERAKFKIESKWFEIYSWPFRYKANVEIEQGVRAISNNDTMLLENVVATYSYSRREWCDMLVLTMLSGISKVVGLDMFTDYIAQKHNLKSSFFYNAVYKDIIVNKKFNSTYLNDKIGGIPEHLYELVENPDVKRLEFDIDESFPMLLSPHSFLTFIIMLNPSQFYSSIADHFADTLGDETIRDLGNYLSNIMIDITYDPATGRSFTTHYNWFSYFNNQTELHNAQYEYTILDKQLKFVSGKEFEYSDYPNMQDEQEKIKQFFYHRGSNGARKKYAQNIVETAKANNETKSQ
jgi:putative methyltransferase